MATSKLEIPFCGASGEGRNAWIDTQGCINYFPESVIMPDGSRKYILRGAPGLVQFADSETDSPLRGWVVVGTILYAVFGTKLYKITTGGVVTSVTGTMTLTSTNVYVLANGPQTQIGIFGGANGYVYTIATDTLAAISDGDFPGASSATYRDGFAIVTKPGTSDFYKSALNDFTSWDALDFDTEVARAGYAIRAFAEGDDLWVMKELSIGIWYNTGSGSGFPYARRDGVNIDVGLAAVDSVASGNNALFWLSKNKNGKGLVMMAVGLQPRVVSPTWLNEILGGYATLSDAVGFTYQFDGHVFYEIVFPTENSSFVYDSTEGLWHERQSYDTGTEILVKHRIHLSIFFNNKLLVGDCETGVIGELLPIVYDEYGVGMPAIRTSQTLEQKQSLITYNELQILFTPGAGLSAGGGVYGDGILYGDGTVYGAADVLDPYAELEWSNHGGRGEWSTPIQIPLGADGDYDTRSIVYQLGQGRNRVWRSTVRTPVNRDIKGAVARVTIDEE